MATNSGSTSFQFRLATLLRVITAICLMLGLLAWLLPDELTIETRVAIYAFFIAAIPYGAWAQYRSLHQTSSTPADYMTVQINAKWLRRVKSPFIFLPIAALTGVSLTFAPFYLFWCGQMQEFGVFEWIVVPLCFLIIYFVPGFYMADEVIAELVKIEKRPSDGKNVEQ